MIAFQLSPRATFLFLVGWIVISVVIGILVGKFIRFGGRPHPGRHGVDFINDEPAPVDRFRPELDDPEGFAAGKYEDADA